MTPEKITTELSDCKSTNRYVVDAKGDRFWVFGLPTGELLVRRIESGMMKPLRTMQYDEVVSIEGMIEESEHPVCGVVFLGCEIETTTQRKVEQMNLREKRLIQFARIVLEILERDKEWNSDTTDAIGQAAYETGLSGLNEFGEFIALEVKAKQ